MSNPGQTPPAVGAPRTNTEGTNMFLSILTIVIAIAAGVYMARHLIFSGFVEGSWREPMPGSGEDGYQDALQTRFRQERTRVRSAVAVAALWVACCVLCAIFKGYWVADAEWIRIGSMLVTTALMGAVAIRVLVHGARLSERSTERTFRHPDRQEDEPPHRKKGRGI